jgi:hypothetical protein
VRYVATVGTLPPRRSQTSAEGRQFFRMHSALLDVVERDLASGESIGVTDESLNGVAVGL